MDDHDESGMSVRGLKCYTDRAIGDLSKHFERMHVDRDKAVKLAFDELQRRLDILNHAHEEMRRRDISFYPKEMHEGFAKETQSKFDAIGKQFIDYHKPWPVYAWFGLFSFIAIVVGGIIHNSQEVAVLQTNQNAVMLELREREIERHAIPLPPKPR